VIVYLNRESYTAGDFSASGVHALQPFINQVVGDIEMPQGGSSVWDAWAEDAGEERLVPYHDGQKRADWSPGIGK